MADEKKKCSSRNHKEIDAFCYCQECKIYMCNKCENFHSDLFQNHHSYKLDKNIEEIFTGFCKEKNHYELKYFCKTHNKLCCGFCITKIKGEGNGQHSDCNICFIKDIKDEKKNKLNENIRILEYLSDTIEKAISDIKKILERLIQNKEDLKGNIQKIFTKIRNILNVREEELLLEVDKKFDILYCNEDIIKNNEKLPNKIKILLEKGKILNKEWNDDNKLNILINDCINIEKNINEINLINEKMQKFKISNNKKIGLSPKENGINEFIEKIKFFGKINYYNNFIFKECPNNISERRKYAVSGEHQNIITKTGINTYYMGSICENELEKGKEHKWKIKILKNKNNNIFVGVAPIDFDLNSSKYNCGWYFYFNNYLYSGPPQNYYGKNANLTEIKDINDEIKVIMNMEKGSLKFIINNEDKGDSYTNIPLDKPLFPAVLLYNTNDSVEIIEC